MADTNKYLNLQGLTEVAEYVNEKLKTVTTMPASPSLNDIVLYKGATTADFKQGSIYSYQTIEEYYQWSDLTDVYYTRDAAPQIGDTVYSDTSGTDSGYTIEAFDSLNNQVTINSLIYDRDTTGDTPINDWVCKSGTLVILNGQNKTGDEANFYAPVSSGTNGQILVSKGDSVAPQWATLSPNGYAPSFLDSSLVFTYGTLPEVDGNTLIFNLDNQG